MKKINLDYKPWAIYLSALLISVYLHEIGHCIPAWAHGFRAVPTPAKEYISGDIPMNVKQYVSLGGIVTTIALTLAAISVFIVTDYRYKSALLAGVIAVPGIYTLRFMLVGRGHDATEFQEAQAAMGLDYSGHALDWIFLTLFLAGAVAWILRSRPQPRIVVRLAVGLIITIVFVTGLQEINNAIFDPVFNYSVPR